MGACGPEHVNPFARASRSPPEPRVDEPARTGNDIGAAMGRARAGCDQGNCARSQKREDAQRYEQPSDAASIRRPGSGGHSQKGSFGLYQGLAAAAGNGELDLRSRGEHAAGDGALGDDLARG